MERLPTVSGTANLLDILDRVLDKGLVIAGDVRISLANVELLTIRIRLLVCSVDKAEQIGLNWWKFDPNLSLSHAGAQQRDQLGFETDARLISAPAAARPKRRTSSKKSARRKA